MPFLSQHGPVRTVRYQPIGNLARDARRSALDGMRARVWHARTAFAMRSTLDGAAAVAYDETLTAADASREHIITTRGDEGLEDATRLMVDMRVEHLLVINPATGHADVLSALDVGGPYAARP